LHTLADGDTIEIAHAQQQVTCLKGRLRITLDHMLADDVMERGERYLAASGSRMRGTLLE